MERKPFSLRARGNSFRYAWAGLLALLDTEHNSRIHLLFTILALIAGFYFRISAVEWMFLIAAFALVWITELVNTAIEKTCDLITQEKHPQIKLIKDVAAAAVLMAALAACLIGLVIFIPELLS